ncbi:MAG TPA: response regulator transcription factor [Fimbriimonadaceae bacterium]|nr:response regulator transcription factor [Fimbriimonadaceae bacterium]
MRILLVEDDRVIADSIRDALERERFDVDVRRDGESGLDATIVGSYALIILDIMLPKRDGFSVCRELRKNKIATPVLMLTARDGVEDRVQGLDCGADDYLAKPFDLRELLARVRALVRRDKIHRTGLISVADLEIDSNAHIVKRAGKEIRLTPREFSLLEALARNEGRTLTREVILENVWGNDFSMDGTVNFHVASLRKKVDGDFPVKLIHTVHGFGYVLRADGGA